MGSPRRNIILACLLMLCLLLPMSAFGANTTMDVQVDGKAVSFKALGTGNLAFLPARSLADLYDASLSYDAEEKDLTIKSGKQTAVFSIGSSTMVLNGKKVSLDASPMIVNNTTYLPVKAAALLWDASYGWNEETLYLRRDGGKINVPTIEKVFFKSGTVTIGEKKQHVQYVTVPKASKLRTDVILAQNAIGQTETLKSMASRSAAKAAINGGYFQSYDNTKLQEPYGILIKNGKLIHAENTGSTIGFTASGDVKLAILRSAVTATVGGHSYSVSMVNHTPSANSNSVVLFTPARGQSTGCNLGTSVIVQNGEITGIVKNQSVTIPANGYVLLFTGNKTSAANSMKKGTKATYQVGYTNAAGTRLDWSNVQTAVSAGPMLLKDGSNVVNPEKEGFPANSGFTLSTNRSAVGVTKDGTVLLVGPVKCTLNQLASVMSQLGATNAIAMDSGSASGIYMNNGKVATATKEISNILIFK